MRSSIAGLTAIAITLLVVPGAQAGIWTEVPSGTTENIRAIEYQSESRLWFATDQGSVFYRQPDGSFAQATMFSGGSTGVLFRDIAATSDGSVVIAVGDAQGTTPNVWRSLDGGHNFARVTLPTVIRRGCGDNSVTGNFGNAWSVFFASNAVVYVTGQNANILKSTDGGGSFAEVNRDAAGNCKVDGGFPDSALTDSAWSSPNRGWFIGRSFGRISRTADGLSAGGTHLRDVVTRYDQQPRLAMDPANENRQWAVDRTGNGIAATEDGWASELQFHNGGLRLTGPGSDNYFDEPRDVATAGGTVVVAGNGGEIATSIDGRNFYFQRADGDDATRPWNATDVAGATHAAVGGNGGVLVLATAANTPPPTLGAGPGAGGGGGAGGGTGGGGPGADAPDTTAPLLDFAGFGADRSGGSVLVTVGCGAREAQGCRVLLRLVTRRKLKATRRAKAKRLEVGRREYTLRAGERLRLRVPLSRLGKRLLRKYKRLSLRADLEIADIAGNKVTTSQTITVEQPKKKRR